MDPWDLAGLVSRRLSPVVEALLETFPWLRLSVSPWDRTLVFYAAFLSRNTDYYANVVPWVRKIASGSWPRSGSYQLRQLRLIEPELSLDPRGDVWEERDSLLSVRWVGPKVAHAFLTFSGRCTSLAPPDVHALRAGARLGLLPRGCAAPTKSWCLGRRCPDCPRVSACASGILFREAGPLASWIQTCLYLLDREMCSRSLCDSCPLKLLCEGL